MLLEGSREDTPTYPLPEGEGTADSVDSGASCELL